MIQGLPGHRPWCECAGCHTTRQPVVAPTPTAHAPAAAGPTRNADFMADMVKRHPAAPWAPNVSAEAAMLEESLTVNAVFSRIFGGKPLERTAA